MLTNLRVIKSEVKKGVNDMNIAEGCGFVKLKKENDQESILNYLPIFGWFG